MTTDKALRQDRVITALMEAIEENGGVECAQVPHVFYPEDFHVGSANMSMVRLAEATAREICMRCPVQALCLKAGFFEEYGIWGGATPEQRRRLKREQQI